MTPRAEKCDWLKFFRPLNFIPISSATEDNLENILNGANGSRLQGPPQSHLWYTEQASEQFQKQSTFNWT